MWRPEGYVTWRELFSSLQEIAEEVLARVCGSPELVDGKSRYPRTAEYYIVKAGHAKDYQEAHLTTALVATWLMSNFMDQHPPVALSIGGTEIALEWAYFTHRDQLELCPFSWPLRENIYFRLFFNLASSSRFSHEEVVDRFPFINTETGMVTIKNGARAHLINILGFSEVSADQALSVATSAKGFQLCWRAPLDECILREFCGELEVDDSFVLALDDVLGARRQSEEDDVDQGKVVAYGRPRKIEAAQHAISVCFPDGTGGSTHKQIRRVIIDQMGAVFSERTIGRALALEQK